MTKSETSKVATHAALIMSNELIELAQTSFQKLGANQDIPEEALRYLVTAGQFLVEAMKLKANELIEANRD